MCFYVYVCECTFVCMCVYVHVCACVLQGAHDFGVGPLFLSNTLPTLFVQAFHLSKQAGLTNIFSYLLRKKKARLIMLIPYLTVLTPVPKFQKYYR